MGTGQSGSVFPPTSAIGSTTWSRLGASPARRSSRRRGHSYWPPSREPSTWSSVRPAGAAARACPGARTSWGCSSTPHPYGSGSIRQRRSGAFSPTSERKQSRRGPTSTPRCPTSRRSPRLDPPRCSTPSSSSTTCTRAPDCDRSAARSPRATSTSRIRPTSRSRCSPTSTRRSTSSFRTTRGATPNEAMRPGAGPVGRDAHGDRRSRRRSGCRSP